MTDWITITIEAVGVIILCVWIVVPIREFRGILRRLVSAGKSSAVIEVVHPDPRNETTNEGET